MPIHARVFLPVLCILVVACVTPAHADLTIISGSPAQQRQVQQAYDAMPSCCHTSCRIRVQLLGGGGMTAYLQGQAAAQHVTLADADAVDGLYQNATPTITLRTASPTADLSATFTHEYGHYFWLNVISSRDRDRYGSLYDKQQRAHRLVSPYAAVSVDEGFAEAFSFYLREKPVLARCDTLSCCFMADLLKPDGKTSDHPVRSCP